MTSTTTVPVSMPVVFDSWRDQRGYGGYGNDSGREYRMVQEITHDARQNTDALANQAARDTHHMLSETRRDTDALANQAGRDTHQIVGETRRDTDAIRADVERQAHYGSNQAQRGFDHILTSVGATAAADQAATRSGIVESRQAVERNADQLATAVATTGTAGVLATQNTSTATQLGVQNTSTATQLGVQTAATATQGIIRDTAYQTTLGTAEVKGLLYGQTQMSLAESKVAQVAAARDFGMIQTTQARDYGGLQTSLAKDLGEMKLQAANYHGEAERRAAEHKGYLENHITKTACDGVLKTVEVGAKILEKIAECCCENKMAHATTQGIVITNTNTVTSAVAATQVSQLQAQLQQAQQEALLARLTPRS